MSRLVVDWGSSSFRAYRFAGDGAVAERHQAEAGILTVTDGQFEAVLHREIGHWITADTEILFSGMITSRNGWVETPYIPCPAALDSLAAGAVVRQGRQGQILRFLPGVSARTPTPDVMRGEEIQVFGSVPADESAIVILPGTHSKWVEVRQGRITGFRTFLTGETYALLRHHSIVGRLIPPGESAFREDAFRAGVRQVRDPGSISLLNDVFTARSGALLGAFDPSEIADRLSGILVGHEIRAGREMQTGFATSAGKMGPPILVGEAGLLARYAVAFEEFGMATAKGPAHAAVEGFRRLSLLA